MRVYILTRGDVQIRKRREEEYIPGGGGGGEDKRSFGETMNTGKAQGEGRRQKSRKAGGKEVRRERPGGGGKVEEFG